MEGVVVVVDADGGVIEAERGTKYFFMSSDWKSAEPPRLKDRVDFVAEGDRAREIRLLEHVGAASTETPREVRAEKTILNVVYGCYFASVLGLPWIVAGVLAHMYRKDRGTPLFRNHIGYQLDLFWKSVIGFVLGGVFFFTGIGTIILLATYAWVLVKTIKGWRALSLGRNAGVDVPSETDRRP